MKSSLIFLLLISSAICQAQIKNDNTIIVKGVGFIQVCNNLLDSGYVIESKDIDLQTVKTEPRLYPRYWNATYSLSIRVKDSTASIAVTFTAPPAGGLFKNEPAKYGPHEKAMYCYPFLLARDFAQSFNGQISYERIFR